MKFFSFSPVEIPRGVWGAGPPSPEEEAKADDETKDFAEGGDCFTALSAN